MNCQPSTLEFYRYTVENFLEWIETRGITSPEEVMAHYDQRPEEAKKKAGSLLHVPYRRK
jgi:hypothetical protein